MGTAMNKLLGHTAVDTTDTDLPSRRRTVVVGMGTALRLSLVGELAVAATATMTAVMEAEAMEAATAMEVVAMEAVAMEAAAAAAMEATAMDGHQLMERTSTTCANTTRDRYRDMVMAMDMDMVETALTAAEEDAALAAVLPSTGSSSTNTTPSLSIPLLTTMASAVRMMGRRPTSRYCGRQNEIPRSSKLN